MYNFGNLGFHYSLLKSVDASIDWLMTDCPFSRPLFGSVWFSCFQQAGTWSDSTHHAASWAARRISAPLSRLRSSRGRCCSPALGRIRTTVWAPHSGSSLSGKPPVLPRDHGCPEPWPLRFRLARNVGLMPGISLAHPALAPKCLCHQKWKPHPKMFSPSPLFQFIASKICLPFSLSSAIRFFLFF